MTGYDTLPTGATGQFERLNVNIPDEKLSQFKELIRIAPIGPVTWENQQTDGKFGVSRQWLVDAKQYWQDSFDWRVEEQAINAFPQFKTTVTDDDGTKHEVHCMALFSQKKDAIPIAFFHGWPGSFLEFLGLCKVMTKRYTPESLPYHIIVPSLVGYTLSSGPPTDRNWTINDTVRIMHKLLISLGFTSYAAQGGDVGSIVARMLGVRYEECKAVHLNADVSGKPDDVPDSAITERESEGLKRSSQWQKTGKAYAMEHGTRPSTIGLALSASPVALLAWIGEKYLEWSDEDPPLEEILRAVSLYWLTDTLPRAIYPYRGFVERIPNLQENQKSVHGDPDWHIAKPFGFSWFPKEIIPMPKAWAAKSGNLVWHRMHEHGGHFAAMERPEDLATDVEDFLKQVWKE
jgi:microsomal epoxide hydrolase